MQRLSDMGRLFFDSIIQTLKSNFEDERVILSVGNLQEEGDGVVVHLLGFLPEAEEKRRIRRLLRGRDTLFVAPTEHHRMMVEGVSHVLCTDYPLRWLMALSDQEGSELEEGLERPFLLFIPYGCGWEGSRGVFAAFRMSLPRLSSNSSLLVALHKCGRKSYETVLRVAEEEEILNRMQPVFVEGLDDVAVLMREASVYVGAVADGMYPFFELSAAALGVPVAALPSSPASERLAGYATLPDASTAYGLASAIIDARYESASWGRRKEVTSTDWWDIAEGIKRVLRGM